MSIDPSDAVQVAAAHWGLELIEKTTSRYSDTWFALRGAEHVVLKVGDDQARRREATALTAYARSPGATAALLDSAEGALLLQRVLPGDDLRPVAAVDDDAATAVIGAVIRRLHAAPTPSPDRATAAGLPRLWDILMAFSRYRDSGSSRLPDSVVRRAHDLATDLTVPSADDRVLHGDLHHQNVLRRLPAAAEDTSAYGAPTGYDAQTSWVAIDPHGWFGDPAFDTAASLLNPHETIAETPDPAQLTRRRAAILAEVTGIPRDRILAWAIAGAVISELWCLEDHDFVAGAPLRLAESLLA